MDGIKFIGTNSKVVLNRLVNDKRYGKKNEALLNKCATVFGKKGYKDLSEKELKATFTFIDSEIGDRNGVLSNYELGAFSRKQNKNWVQNGLKAYNHAFEEKLNPNVDENINPKKDVAQLEYNKSTKKAMDKDFKAYAKEMGISPTDAKAKQAFMLTIADLKINDLKNNDKFSIGYEVSDKDVTRSERIIKRISHHKNSNSVENFNDKFSLIYSAMYDQTESSNSLKNIKTNNSEPSLSLNNNGLSKLAKLEKTQYNEYTYAKGDNPWNLSGTMFGAQANKEKLNDAKIIFEATKLQNPTIKDDKHIPIGTTFRIRN